MFGVSQVDNGLSGSVFFVFLTKTTTTRPKD